MKKIFYYTGTSPFVQRYVNLKNQDGWHGWTDREINELLQGYWVTQDTPVFQPDRPIVIQPSILECEDSEAMEIVKSRLDTLQKEEKVKKVEKNFDIKKKLFSFAENLKRYFIWLFKKLLMENE